jgi:diguanylate cyclase (GGDEF)-like protein
MQAPHEKRRRFYKPLLLVFAIGLVLLIGWVRFLTGPEFAFSLLFLLPIVAVTWLVGPRWGILVSVVSTFSWLFADLCMIDRFSNSTIPLVNESFRLIVFLFIVLMITRHKKLLETQRELAMMDPLTGVANRRSFLQLARMEIDRSRRYNHPFSVMVMDIDDFKRINDHFGHHTGDQLLNTVAETLKTHVRAIDIVARFGGDEFVALLVKTEETAAALIASKLQRQLLCIMKENQWQVTFSIGLATYHSSPDSVDETIKAADELMYHVKHNGKDNIRQAVIET